MKKLKNLTRCVANKADLLLLGLMGGFGCAFASGTGDQSFGALNTFLEGMTAGTAGITISILAFFGGVATVFGTGYKMTGAVVALGIPILIHFGPTIFEGLSGAGAVI